MEVHTLSTLRTIYAQRTIGLDSDFLHDVVRMVPNRAKHHMTICYPYVRIEEQLAATFLGNLRSMLT